MTLVDELQKKYPITPRDVVVKGNTMMIEKGVMPGFLSPRLEMASIYGDAKSNKGGAS